MQKTILIVDDFENTRYVTRMTLRRYGYHIIEAEDGVEALKLFDGRNIDLVITDHNMPNMDGITLVENIRQLQTYKYIPILLLTTEKDPNKKKRAQKAGITGWIQKPFTFNNFTKIVQKALK